ncbi:hypothetical protein B9J80_00230 [Vibrio sp. V12_P9A6T4]|uniref:hypothetical protein n=1 Tax=Vibrio sp. V12_P9A6T4 TaxID=1938667 RepID=UPI000B8EB7EE|nr:hypothetical protein [Vibrio sp. V12_P9A6T4]OXX57698.1 hypothetical protein B9J80_00230 [Vibrio sp. V12_P9A6T4]
MGITTELEFWFIGVPTIILGGYVFIWAIPGVVFGAVLAFGDVKRITWIDAQLSKDTKKLHSNYQCMMPYNIMSRFMHYCFAYPFIRHRITTSSIKFRVFMWVNSLGFWSFLGVGLLVLLAKTLNIIP